MNRKIQITLKLDFTTNSRNLINRILSQKGHFTPYEFILIIVIWWSRFQDVWYGRYLN